MANGTDFRQFLAGTADDFEQAAWSKATVKTYKADWAIWEAWATAHTKVPFPADPRDVAEFLADQARTVRATTLMHRISGISHYHRRNGAQFDRQHETLRRTWRGIVRTVGLRKEGKAALSIDELRSMLKSLPDNLRGKRDRAMLLVCFAGAFRRSELVGLDFRDIEFARDGVLILLRRSKTDQAGLGIQKAILYGAHKETCPVRALKAWVEASAVRDGPLFRRLNEGKVGGRLSDRAFYDVVKVTAKRAGLDADRFGAHSLRSGHVTQAAMNGAADRDIMAQTGHKKVESMHGYIRRTELFKRNSSGSLDL